MTTHLTWGDIVLRLVLTCAAGAVIGVNRGEHARPAGLRTTLLVCLAASLSMILANTMLDMSGKAPDSFIVMDLMRLPLGILSGIGFIGAGAILRKDNMVVGVTTAATLWFVTVMGLCFGGGQLGLGLAALVLGWLILSGLKRVEEHWKQDRRGMLTVAVAASGPDEDEISRRLAQTEYKIVSWSVHYENDSREREYRCALRWQDKPFDTNPPTFLKEFAALAGVQKLDWQPM